jgi:hypothetical protein
LSGFCGSTKKNRLTLYKKLIHCIQHMKITYTVKIDDEGNKRWYHNNQLHRTDGPAVEYANGNKSWYVDGKCHRADGPAVEYANGDKYWYVDDKLHRTDGPAVEWANGSKSWYLDDVGLTEAQWRKRVAKPNCEGRVVEVDGVQYKLVAL